ncbi:MAG: FAD binding domain-containing protein, partial [Desulfobacterales bacterium]|nr:FAD binding domain-containing protein [Desulfobacterales bacterium]
MRGFEHINAKTVKEAVARLNKYNGAAKTIAGGTDLLGALRDGIWPDPPGAIINLKSISGLSYIKEGTQGLKIGALTTLTDIAESAVVKKNYTALANAAGRTASPLLRNLGTLAGNICQENRCWYYRYP